MKTEKRLIEEWLPLREVNFDVDIEMAFKFLSRKYYNKFEEIYGFKPRAINTRAPRIRNMHLWLARRPCGAARVLTLAALLSPTTNREFFKKALALDEVADLINWKLPPAMIFVNPKKEIVKEIVRSQFNKKPDEFMLVDPMAGGGSISLESLRLGFKTIAIEYNPVAYIILKATLEYPARYGERLYEDVRKEAKALIEYAKAKLSKYYAEDAYNYIFARGFKCPGKPGEECGGLVPIIFGIRLRQKGPYIKFTFDKINKRYDISIIKEETKFEKLKCPYCERPFTEEEIFRQWVPKHKEILKIALEGDIEGAKNHIDSLLKTHIPFLKQTRRGFRSCDDEDFVKFVDAYLNLAKEVKELKQYLLNSRIPKENEVFEPIKSLGIDYWYELFNPRQLLVFLKLIKYINERAKELIKDKGEYGAAIATYLVLGLDKLLDYNNIATMWHTHRGVMNRLGDQYASEKRVSLGLEYCEAKRIDLALSWVFEPDVDKPTATTGGICPVLKELCGWVDGLGDIVEVYMGDAREFSMILGKDSVDLVNVDPPYFNQHFYSDLSEFFWQVLTLTLKPVIEAGYLFNRNKKYGRVECLVSGWSPSLPVVPRAGEIIVRKVNERPDIPEIPFTKEWWREQMWRFFSEAFKVLKDDGVLIVWYTHSDPEAWEAVLSGLYASKFLVTKAWNVRTEAGRFIARHGGSAFFTSLALVARKTGESIIVGERIVGELKLNEQVKKVIIESVEDALESARVSGASDREAYIMALAGAIAGATRIRNPAIESEAVEVPTDTLNRYVGDSLELEISKRVFKKLSHFFRESLYPVALTLGASKVLEDELVRAGLSEDEKEIVASTDEVTQAYLLFWLSTRYTDEESKAFIDYDFAEKICKVLGIVVGDLEKFGLLKKIVKGSYLVSFGQEVFDNLRGKLELLDKTAVGEAIYLLKRIVDSPVKDDDERCARGVVSVKPVSRQVVATALFLLKTAREEELRKASIHPQYTRPFVERVLRVLMAR
ncbi:MAG: hypothetical protein QXH67_00115 [Candidatus Bathyarchaeia archaeon]